MAKIADKIATLKTKLQQLEAEQKKQERAARQAEATKARKEENRCKFELGGLVKLAGLHNVDRGALLGALMSLEPLLADPQQAPEFKRYGDVLLARRERERKSSAPPVPATDDTSYLQ